MGCNCDAKCGRRLRAWMEEEHLRIQIERAGEYAMGICVDKKQFLKLVRATK